MANCASERQKADDDDRQIEQVPALPEIVPRPAAAGGDLQHLLGHEDPQDHVLDENDRIADRRPFAERRIRLEADQDAGQDDQPQNERLKPGGIDDALCLLDHESALLRTKRFLPNLAHQLLRIDVKLIHPLSLAQEVCGFLEGDVDYLPIESGVGESLESAERLEFGELADAVLQVLGIT